MHRAFADYRGDSFHYAEFALEVSADGRVLTTRPIGSYQARDPMDLVLIDGDDERRIDRAVSALGPSFHAEPIQTGEHVYEVKTARRSAVRPRSVVINHERCSPQRSKLTCTSGCDRSTGIVELVRMSASSANRPTVG